MGFVAMGEIRNEEGGESSNSMSDPPDMAMVSGQG